MRMVPRRSRVLAAASASSISCRMARTRCRYDSPASVSASLRVVRCSRRVPRCCSSSATMRVTTGGDMSMARAAAAKPPSSTTRSKIFMACRRSMVQASCLKTRAPNESAVRGTRAIQASDRRARAAHAAQRRLTGVRWRCPPSRMAQPFERRGKRRSRPGGCPSTPVRQSCAPAIRPRTPACRCPRAPRSPARSSACHRAPRARQPAA